MRTSFFSRSAAGLVWVVLSAAPAGAQIFESVGTRAQGMGGAFVAVADDATASWWNPAGLASGATLNILYEHGRITEPTETSGLVPASQTTPNSFAAAFPASTGIETLSIILIIPDYIPRRLPGMIDSRP